MMRPDAIPVRVPRDHDARLMAYARHRVGLKVTNHRVDEINSDAHLNHQSLRAIWAVCTYLQVPFDWDRCAVRGNDGQTKLTFAGLTVDVKYTARLRRPLWLFYNDPMQLKADVTILCSPGVSENEIVILGWVTRAAFLQLGIWSSLPNRGRRFVLDFLNLEPMATLLQQRDLRPVSAAAAVEQLGLL